MVKRKFFIGITALIVIIAQTMIPSTAFATESIRTDLPQDKGNHPDIAITQKNDDFIDITINFFESPLYQSQEQANAITFDEQIYVHTSERGVPDLPVLKKAIEVPFAAQLSIEIIDSKYETKTLSELGLPSYMPLREPEVIKCNKPDAATRGSGESWVPDGSFYPTNIVQIEETYVIRGHRVAQVALWPVQYEALTEQVRIYSSITLRLSMPGANHRLTETNAEKFFSPSFDSLLASNLLNYNQGLSQTNDRALTGDGYLIIAPDAFIPTLSNFASFKESLGFQVSLISLSTTGTTPQSIKNFIQTAYDTWPTPPSYVLLVGDVNNGANSLPAFEGVAAAGAVTDLYYATTDGADYIPDIFVGRLPARNITQLNAILNNIINYYYLSGNEPWVKKAALLASDDPNNWHVAEGTQDYVINTHTQRLGYSGSFPTSPMSGGDKLYGYSYAADQADVITSVNEGRALITYTGHGSRSAWGGPVFSQTDILNISATQVFSIVTSFACITGDYATTEAFGETWLLQENKGGVIFIGASNSTYWGPDDILEREMMDFLFSGNEGANIAGSFFYAGLMGVQSAFTGTAIGQSQYYWESYNMMGDPALQAVIEPKTPDFSLQADPHDLAVCKGNSSSSLVTIKQINAFSEPVTLSVDNVPSGVGTVFSDNPIAPPGASTLTLSTNNSVADGQYLLSLNGDANAINHALQLELGIYTVPPEGIILSTPSNYATGVSTHPTFEWETSLNSHTYKIEISADPSFDQIIITKEGLRQAQFIPQVALGTNETYYWRVTGENPCGPGTSSEIFLFTTQPSPGDCPSNMEPHILYENAFENEPLDWQHHGTNDTWVLQNEKFYSPIWSFFSSGVNTTSLQYLISPIISLPDTSESPLALKFWQWFDIEDSAFGCYDGAMLEISIDQGQTWMQINSSQLITLPYQGIISTNYGNPIGGTSAWCGAQDWIETVVDLNAYAGEDIQLRFTHATDESISQKGWYLDELTIQSCQAMPPYQPSITPEYAQTTDLPGSTVTIQLQIKNAGLNSDEYTLNLSSEKWQANLETKETVVLNPGESAMLHITITIPENARLGETNTVTFSAISINDPDDPPASDTVQIKAMAGYETFIPLIKQND